MPPVGFEPTISEGERPQTYALDPAATGTSTKRFWFVNNSLRHRCFPDFKQFSDLPLISDYPTNYIRSGEDDAHIGGQQIPCFY